MLWGVYQILPFRSLQFHICKIWCQSSSTESKSVQEKMDGRKEGREILMDCVQREGLSFFSRSLASEILTLVKHCFLLSSHPLLIVHLTFKTEYFTLQDKDYLFCFLLKVYWGVLIKEPSGEF